MQTMSCLVKTDFFPPCGKTSFDPVTWPKFSILPDSFTIWLQTSKPTFSIYLPPAW